MGIGYTILVVCACCRRLVQICILSIYVCLFVVSWLPCFPFACRASPTDSAVASLLLCYYEYLGWKVFDHVRVGVNHAQERGSTL